VISGKLLIVLPQWFVNSWQVGLPDKCLPFAQPDSSLTNSDLTVRPLSGAGPDPNPVIHCLSESLLTTQVFFRRLHGNMSQ
jgi:hypothetical protein